MRAVITVLDATTETSMPFNEFVLYRANHYRDEKEILVICGLKRKLPDVTIPETLEIKYAGRNLSNIRRVLKSIISELNKESIPYVIHMHQLKSGFLTELAMIGTGFRKKVLFTVHSTFSGYKFHNKCLSFVNTLFAYRITCVSNVSYYDYPKLIKRIKGNRMQALQNGVDTERIDSILSTPEPREGVSFIYVARLIPLKNHKFLVDVLKKCDKQVHFIFVGAEDKEREVRKKAEELGVIERITFTGLIPRNAVYQKLQEADYYISSSTLEGLPISVLEAMYCGLPCVLSDIPQHREVVGDKAVILPYDIDAWSKEINRLASIHSTERQKMGEEIKHYAKKNFSLETMHKKYDAIYELL